MVEFSGEFSEVCKNYMLKRNAIVGFISALIPTISVAIPVVIGIFMWNWIFVVVLPVLILIPILATASPYIYKTKTISQMMPKKIIIDEMSSIKIEWKNRKVFKEFSCVKKIIDKGDWYKIILQFPKIDGLICQKNLITKGTIDEFEKLFEGKIVKNK